MSALLSFQSAHKPSFESLHPAAILANDYRDYDDFGRDEREYDDGINYDRNNRSTVSISTISFPKFQCLYLRLMSAHRDGEEVTENQITKVFFQI